LVITSAFQGLGASRDDDSKKRAEDPPRQSTEHVNLDKPNLISYLLSSRFLPLRTLSDITNHHHRLQPHTTSGLTTVDHIPLPIIMAEMQNSNPTILSAADLPTRSRSTEKKTGDYALGIFAAVPKPTDFLSSDSEGDEDLLEEPIDEQEIYGMQCNSLPPHLLNPFSIQITHN
jgi:hypothetical protein